MRKNWKKILDEIRKRCLEKGVVGVDDVIEVAGDDIHPNYALQLMSIVAKADPNKFVYEEQRLKVRRRFRGAISVVKYDHERGLKK